jgi:hypothetical protein
MERDQLLSLARWGDEFARPDFSFGEWVPARTDDAGVIHMGWYEQNEVARRFVSEMYQLGFVHEFDWMTWLGTPEGERFRTGPEAVATADADDLARLLTAIIRGERFSDGELAGALKSGILPAIARRAGDLAGGT